MSTFRATSLTIPGPLLISSEVRSDERGTFQETFRTIALNGLGITEAWVQDNHALTYRRGTLRGLHFQRPPHAQAKLVRVIRGAISDVIVDLRHQSPAYGQHEIVELTSGEFTQLYVPAGFAHGYCTLTNNVEVLYKTSAEYAPESEGGLRWDDPDLSIPWPIREMEVALRDEAWPDFAKFSTPF